MEWGKIRVERGEKGGGEGEEGREKRKLPLGWGSFRGVYLLDMGISGIICSKRSFF